MRLLSPSPGEVIDRLTILQLKSQAAEKRGSDASYFLAEKALLEDYLRKWDEMLREDDDPPKETWDKIKEKRVGLTAVNTLLWDAEDQVRDTPETEMMKLAQLCKRIARLNDSRAKLVNELTGLYGVPEALEKMYGTGITRHAG